MLPLGDTDVILKVKQVICMKALPLMKDVLTVLSTGYLTEIITLFELLNIHSLYC